MDIIEKAILDIKFEIPNEILTRAFLKQKSNYRQRGSFSLDEAIRQLIRSKVLTDCNVVGGITEHVSLDNLSYQKPTDHEYIFKIPKTSTGGKTILSVRTVSFLSYGYLGATSGVQSYGGSSYGYGDNSLALGVAQAGLEAFDRIPVISTARVSLIGENLILIHDTLTMMPYGYLTCELENEDNLANLPLRSSLYFSELCIWAVKAYIYTKMLIVIDQNEIQSGYQIGSFKEMISGWSDAAQNYRDFLKNTWMKVAFQSDDRKMTSFLKMKFSAQR